MSVFASLRSYISHSRFFGPMFHRHISYSQEGEDLVLQALIGDRKTTGMYIDIGAHHPFLFSNTYLFYKKRWRGLNIEPTPGVIERFKRVRGKDINVQMAVGPCESEIAFYLYHIPAFNTASPERVTELKGLGIEPTGQVRVPQSRLDRVLDQYWPDGAEITFMNVDVEGLDLAVLKTNDWYKYRPEFLLVEHVIHEENGIGESLAGFVEGLDYELVARTMFTSIYRSTTEG